jgi:hypothetical protein
LADAACPPTWALSGRPAGLTDIYGEHESGGWIFFGERCCRAQPGGGSTSFQTLTLAAAFVLGLTLHGALLPCLLPCPARRSLYHSCGQGGLGQTPGVGDWGG